MKRKLRFLWQLYLSYLFIILLSLIAATWFASRSLKEYYLQQKASDLEARAHLVESQMSEYLSLLNQERVDPLCKRIGERAETRITVILPTGEVIGDTAENPELMDNHGNRPEILEAFKSEVGISTRYSRTLGKNMMYVATPLKEGDRVIAVIRTSLALTPIEETIESIQDKIMVGALLITIIAAMLGLLVSRRISRPLEKVKEGAEHFARGELGYRLPASGTEEMSALAHAMNQMASQLDDRIKTVLRQRNELEAVLSSMVEGVIAVDMNARVISMNEAGATMFGCDPSDAYGCSIQEVARNRDLQQFIEKALSSEGLVEKDITIYGEQERIFNCHGTSLRDEEGNRMGALIVLGDITRLKRLEHIRRDFVANVTHEIKTPLTAIKGFSETLRTGQVKSPQDNVRFLGIIDKHVDRLGAIIEDLLNLAKER